MMNTDHQRLVGRIQERLRWLGSTPDDVADRLWLDSARSGSARSALANPVLRFLHGLVDVKGELRLRQGADELEVRLGGRPVGVPLPSPVQEFLDRFSRGLHPELEGR